MTTNKVTGVHPVSQLFPPLPDDEFAGLVKSIRLTGQQSPITCDPNGLLLDGINRLKACEAVGVEPRIAIHHGDPIEFILAANIVRRHLSMGQRMMISRWPFRHRKRAAGVRNR